MKAGIVEEIDNEDDVIEDYFLDPASPIKELETDNDSFEELVPEKATRAVR